VRAGSILIDSNGPHPPATTPSRGLRRLSGASRKGRVRKLLDLPIPYPPNKGLALATACGTLKGEISVDDQAILTKVQKFTVLVLAGMLIVVMVLSTIHLGVLICHEIWTPPRFLIRVQGLPDIFGYFLLVLIGVELIETLKAYVKKDAIHIRVVLEVALIAMARKVIIEEPNNVPSLTLFGDSSPDSCVKDCFSL
jgi:uncharacterized membrane protein (DUF373 family)